MQAAGPLSRHDRLVWAAVLPLLLYLTLTGAGATPGVFITPFRVVSLVILLVVFAGWAISALVHRSARPRTTLAVPIVLALIVLAASTVMSVDPREGAEFVGYAVILAALYLLLVILMGRPALARRIALVLAGATLALAVAYLLAVINAWIGWWGLVGHLAPPPTRPGFIGLTYESPGILSAFLVTAAGSSIAVLNPRGRRAWAMVTLFAVLVGVDVVLAGTRGAWLGVAVAVALTGVVAVATGGRIAMPRSTRARLAVGGVGLVAVAGLIAITPAIVARLTAGGEQTRLTFWAAALRDFVDHPILGSGPGTWAPLRLAYTHAGEIDEYIPHAHNVALQTLAETGLVGVITGVVLGAAVLRLVVPAIRSADAMRRALGLGALFVGSYLLAQQMVDFFMDDPAILFATVLPVAALDAVALRDADAGASKRLAGAWRSMRLGPSAAVAGALISLVLLVRVEWPAMIAWQASDQLSAGQDEAALQQVGQALAGDPGQPAYLWIQALAAAGSGDPALARDDFRAVAEHDDLPQAWLNLAALDLDAGDTAASANDLERALRLGIQQPAVALPAAELWLRLGNEESALRAATAAIAGAPSLAGDPWWSTSPGLAQVHDEVVSSILAGSDPATAWQVAMYAGDPAAARTLVGQLPSEDQRLPTLVIDAWEGLPGALDALEADARAQPQSAAPSWAARVAEHDDDPAAAADFRRWVELGWSPALTSTAYDTVVTDHVAVFRQLPGPDANFHFWHVYRRTVPMDMLIDELPKLAMQ